MKKTVFLPFQVEQWESDICIQKLHCCARQKLCQALNEENSGSSGSVGSQK